MNYPSIIERLKFSSYLNDPCDEPSLTSSGAKALIRKTPREVWEETPRLNPDHVRKDQTKFDMGTAVHAILVGVGDNLSVIDADSYRGKAAQELRQAALDADLTPILAGQYQTARNVAQAASEGLSQNPDVGPILRDSDRELSMFWREAGITHRARPDFYHRKTNTIIHLKTTEIQLREHTLGKYLFDQGHAETAAHYHAAQLRATDSKVKPRQFFVVVNIKPPHVVATIGVSPMWIEHGQMMRDQAINTWGRCLKSNNWPGLSSETIWPELPEFAERRMIEIKDAYEAAESSGKSLLDIGLHWQAPVGWQKPASIEEYGKVKK